jgi:hypothetical protein
MAEYPWVSDACAAAMIAVALYCVARLALSLITSKSTRRDADAVHGVMAVSMAGMFQPALATGHSGLWVLVFSASALWFGWGVLHEWDHLDSGHALGSQLNHLVMCAAMVYMLLVMGSGASGSPRGAGMLAMDHQAAAPSPFLAIMLAVLLLGDVALNAVIRLVPVAPAPDSGRALVGAMVSGSALPRPAVPDHSGPVHGPQRARRLLGTPGGLAPRSALFCQLVMSLAMGYMLVTLS